MLIYLNKNNIQTDSLTLLELLHEQRIDSGNKVIAHNDEVIPKTLWNTTTLQPNDHVGVFQMIAGG